jgi:hypothetical protein
VLKCESGLPEKLAVAQLVKKLYAVYGTGRLVTVGTTVSIVWRCGEANASETRSVSTYVTCVSFHLRAETNPVAETLFFVRNTGL